MTENGACGTTYSTITQLIRIRSLSYLSSNVKQQIFDLGDLSYYHTSQLMNTTGFACSQHSVMVVFF